MIYVKGHNACKLLFSVTDPKELLSANVDASRQCASTFVVASYRLALSGLGIASDIRNSDSEENACIMYLVLQ